MSRTCRVTNCNRAHFAADWCQMHYARVRRYGNPNASHRRVIQGNDEERFLARIEKTAGCWIWTGQLYRNGYGSTWISVQKRNVMAHRYSYEKFVGEIPQGLQIDHVCMNRRCVNPEHLRLATNKQNNEHQRLRSDNSTGYRGVEFSHGKYRVVVQHHGIRHRGGSFESAEAANEAAVALRNRLFTHNEADRA